MAGGDSNYIDFSAAARLMKWPSVGNMRREGELPYTLKETTLEACLEALAEKPGKTRHLYEIHTAAQPPLVTEIISHEHAFELARLKDFL